MSRIGKLPIKLGAGVKVSIADGDVEVQGPKGKLRQTLPPGIRAEVSDDQLARVEKLVVFFGSVTPEWVVERVNAAFQFVASALGQASLREFYVLMVPPHKKDPPRFFPIVERTVRIVDGSESARLDANVVTKILGEA